MEWTWRQQLFMLLQSGGVGFFLGIVYDLFVTVGRVRRFTRPAVFVRDAFFGVVAAMVTFYFSLSIMDGRLHPLLFTGIFCGFVVQHMSVSRLLCRVIYRLGILLAKGWSLAGKAVTLPFAWIFTVCRRFFAGRREDRPSDSEKKAKKFLFFQKNS